MARIPYFDLSQALPSLQALISTRKPLNLYRMLAHGDAVAEGFLALGGAILRQSELDPRLRELVILRVGALSDARYEVFQHRRVATQAGVEADKIEAVLRHPQGSVDAQAFTALEQDLLNFTDAVVRDVKAPEAAFQAVAEQLSHRQLVEVLMTIGFYMLVCRFLENLEVDIETPS